MKTILFLLSISPLLLFQTDKKEYSHHNAQCDSLILQYLHDPDLQKECDAYYEQKLKQIPRVKSKRRKKFKGAKTLADSIKKEIEYLVTSYKWTDSGVNVNFLADDIFPIPSFRGTTWEDSAITAYVKGPNGCQKIQLKRDNGFLSGMISLRDTSNYTIHITSNRFLIKEELYFTQSQSVTLTAEGDTVSKEGHDINEYGGTLSQITKKYLGFSGQRVSLKAQCNRIDTVEVRCKKYKHETCFVCKGIDIVSAGQNTMYGYISKGKKVVIPKNCKDNPCEITQVPIALYLINSMLKGYAFIIISSERGPMIYSSCEECRKDTSSVLFPSVN